MGFVKWIFVEVVSTETVGGFREVDSQSESTWENPPTEINKRRETSPRKYCFTFRGLKGLKGLKAEPTRSSTVHCVHTVYQLLKYQSLSSRVFLLSRYHESDKIPQKCE